MNLSVGAAFALAAEERWFLVHTQVRAEARAQFHLKRQGFRTFFPEMLKTIRHARQLRTVRTPFFPRYIFIVLDLSRDRWLSVRSTIGVNNLFTCDNRPTPVPHGVVEDLITRTKDLNLLAPPEFEKGQQVRVASGPLAGLLGTIGRLDENGRVRVLLEMMNSVVLVDMERFRLLPIA